MAFLEISVYKNEAVNACDVKKMKFKNFRFIGILEDLILP
jgi:hypothetical protein